MEYFSFKLQILFQLEHKKANKDKTSCDIQNKDRENNLRFCLLNIVLFLAEWNSFHTFKQSLTCSRPLHDILFGQRILLGSPA